MPEFKVIDKDGGEYTVEAEHFILHASGFAEFVDGTLSEREFVCVFHTPRYVADKTYIVPKETKDA